MSHYLLKMKQEPPRTPTMITYSSPSLIVIFLPDYTGSTLNTILSPSLCVKGSAYIPLNGSLFFSHPILLADQCPHCLHQKMPLIPLHTQSIHFHGPLITSNKLYPFLFIAFICNTYSNFLFLIIIFSYNIMFYISIHSYFLSLMYRFTSMFYISTSSHFFFLIIKYCSSATPFIQTTTIL
ncbi:hypothetical protein MANES_03G027750v8 [Manihot esculenta]|uniref:Uncharacterized protein n=1 Tax=Manihot esculenta TaxID=3983 RepID=A0ACB7HXD7_MANES|nr:hypothetical protein MANES_03G027750v8 [Manihot esculenta]